MRDFLINRRLGAYSADFQHNKRIACRPGDAGYSCKLLVFRVLGAWFLGSWLKIKVLDVWGEEKVKFFEKFLQKNLEVKKKSVSLQPI